MVCPVCHSGRQIWDCVGPLDLADLPFPPVPTASQGGTLLVLEVGHHHLHCRTVPPPPPLVPSRGQPVNALAPGQPLEPAPASEGKQPSPWSARCSSTESERFSRVWSLEEERGLGRCPSACRWAATPTGTCREMGTQARQPHPQALTGDGDPGTGGPEARSRAESELVVAGLAPEQEEQGVAPGWGHAHRGGVGGG